MPIYEYQCTQCGHHVEVLQKMTDEPLRRCDACGEDTLDKLVSATSFQLKGSGWYKASPTEHSAQGSAPAGVAQTKTKSEKSESSSATDAGAKTVTEKANSTDKKDV